MTDFLECTVDGSSDLNCTLHNLDIFELFVNVAYLEYLVLSPSLCSGFTLTSVYVHIVARKYEL